MNERIKELLAKEAILSEQLAQSIGEDCYIEDNFVYNEEELVRPVSPREKILVAAIQDIRDAINEIK